MIARQRKTGMVAVGLLMCVLILGAPGETRAESGALWTFSWSRDSGFVLPPSHGGQLVAYGPDVALLLLPDDAAPAEGGRWTRIGAWEASGTYYLYLCEDARHVGFADPARVLHREGHTVILWTSGAEPRPAAESRDALRGLRQLIRVSPAPRSWTDPSSIETDRQAEVGFEAVVDLMVQQVTEATYVDGWQTLDDFETRYTYTDQNEAAAQWMYDHMQSYGLDAEFHVYDQQGPRKNVVATLPGLVDDKVVYLVGHFDSTSEDPENHAPGADDNGSGTAAFLEAARVLSQYAFEHTIKFVGFNGEEQGLVGSFEYVSQISAEGEEVIGCYNLDMIAYRGEEPDPADFVIYTNSESFELAHMLSEACVHYFGEEVGPTILPEPLGASDHYSFWMYDYKAILGIEAEAWSGDFCPWYHTSEDRIEKYPPRYPTIVTASAVAAVAQTALPLEAGGVTTGLDVAAARLEPAFPNPSASRVVLRVLLPARETVDAAVFDTNGRRIRSLYRGSLERGLRELSWNGFDDHGRAVGSGVYYLQVATPRGPQRTRVVKVN